jgi:predicted transcriptional regulator of viral defense system
LFQETSEVFISRPLSPLESKLILHLEWEKQPVVTVQETMDILDCSYDHARQVLHRLSHRRWLAPITPGKYEPIPAERGEHAFPDTNPLFIGSTLLLFFRHGLLFPWPFHSGFGHRLYRHHRTQGTAVAHRAGQSVPSGPSTGSQFLWRDQVDAYGSQVMMGEPEKTIVDSLDRPAYAGDIPDIAAMLWRGKG